VEATGYIWNSKKEKEEGEEVMRKSRAAQRDELKDSTLGILREFDDWFLPATMDEVGREFLLFLKWLDTNGYEIIKSKI